MNQITVIEEHDQKYIVLMGGKKYVLVKSNNLINLKRGVVFEASYLASTGDHGYMSELTLFNGKTSDGMPILKHSEQLEDVALKNEPPPLDENRETNYEFEKYVRYVEMDLANNKRSKYFSAIIDNMSKLTDDQKTVFSELSKRYRSTFLKNEYFDILEEIDLQVQLNLLKALVDQKNRFFGIEDFHKHILSRIKSLESALKIAQPKNMRKLLRVGEASNLHVGGQIYFKGKDRTIKNIGRTFSVKSGPYEKFGFVVGEEVCWVYFEDTIEPQASNSEMTQPASIDISSKEASDYFNAIKDYYNIITFIKGNAVKPMHTPAEISRIKAANVLCDSRNKIEGCAWIACDDDSLWYISHKLSATEFDNNIKINDQFAQCWRIPMRHIQEKMSRLEEINNIVFLSNLTPDEY